MSDTAGTMIKGIETLVENGIEEVIVVITHGIFSGPAIKRFNDCKVITKIIVSDSIPQENNKLLCSKIEVFKISNLMYSYERF